MRFSVLSAAAAAASLLLVAESAHAESVIKNPTLHEPYLLELEPHLDLGLLHYGGPGFGAARGTEGSDFGAGFRATIKIVDPGFIPRLNNTIGITFGADFADCPDCGSNLHVYLPVGMQWNFYLLRELSVFAEPGIILRIGGDKSDVYPDFLAEAGVRWHFARRLALTGRVGYPFLSVGLSIFAG